LGKQEGLSPLLLPFLGEPGGFSLIYIEEWGKPLSPL